MNNGRRGWNFLMTGSLGRRRQNFHMKRSRFPPIPLSETTRVRRQHRNQAYNMGIWQLINSSFDTGDPAHRYPRKGTERWRARRDHAMRLDFETGLAKTGRVAHATSFFHT